MSYRHTEPAILFKLGSKTIRILGPKLRDLHHANDTRFSERMESQRVFGVPWKNSTRWVLSLIGLKEGSNKRQSDFIGR